MNAIDLARTAYTTPAAPTRTDRGTEYEAFAQITCAMRRAIAGQDRDFPALVAALHRNRQLWTVLAAGVADPANRLAPELRARLFHLAEFTLHHTGEVLARRADAGVLTEINAAVMQGLRGAAPATPANAPDGPTSAGGPA